MYLLTFILGMIFIDLFIPLTEKLFEYFMTVIQLQISYKQADMCQVQKLVDDLQNDKEEVQTNAIGFTITDEEYEDDDDE